MKKKSFFFYCFFLLFFIISNSYAAPFLTSDPYIDAMDGEFEIYEIINFKNYNYLDLLYQSSNEADGSIKFDLQNLQPGVYNLQTRYYVDGIYSDIELFVITVEKICTKSRRGKRECHYKYDIQY